MQNHVIICGLGHIGYRSFELLKGAGISVAVITDKTPEDWKKKVEDAGGIVLIGDARNDQLLIQAGIQNARAVLAVTDQDLANVSVVMDTRRMNPKARIVCRLFDTSLGKHISESLGVSAVFSTSELAAPFFVEGISKTQGASDSDGRFILSGHLENGRPIAQFTDGEISAPSAQAKNQLLVGLRAQKPQQESLLEKLKHCFFAPNLGKFRKALLFIGAVIAGAAVVVKTAMHLSWIDAFYFVTTTITTVGYGDHNFMNASSPMKVFGIILMLVGASSLAILFSAVAEAVLSERLSSLFGGRPVPKRNHVVLVGAGHIGARVAELLLQDGLRVVIIENDRTGRFPAEVKRRVAVIEGDPRSQSTLRQARYEKAAAIIAVSDDDVENLSVALSAKTLNSNVQTIVRVFDADLGTKLQNQLAINQILSVSGSAAPYFVAAVMGNEIKAATRWHNHLVFLAKEVTEPKAKKMESGYSPLSLGILPLNQ